jgi:putative peptidoglycan lipid II flippase
MLTLASRIAGLVRDMVIAAAFGASAAADAFFVAFRVPNFFRRLFAEGAFAAAFVPVLAAYRTQRTREDVARLIAGVAGVLGGTLALLCGLAMLGADGVAVALAPGFTADPERLALTRTLLWLTFPYVVFVSLTALAAAVLNAHERFGPPALAPLVLNVTIIVAAVWLAPRLDVPVLALGVGVLAAGVLQLGLQLPFLARLGLLRWPRITWRDSGVRNVFAAMLPALFGASVAQVNLLVDTWLASFMTAGTVSWLYYAERLLELPVGVLAVGLATVTLPFLSRLHANADASAFAATLDWSLRLGMLAAVPAAVALGVLATPLMFTLFGRGAFSATDAQMSAYALQAYAVGLPGIVAVKLLAPGYYARGDVRTPVRIGVVCVGVNLALAVPGAWAFGHVGLAAATAVAALLNALLLQRGLRTLGLQSNAAAWRRDGLAIGSACLAMLLLLWVAQAQVAWQVAGTWLRVLALLGLCAAGGVTYLCILHAFGLRPSQMRAPPRL